MSSQRSLLPVRDFCSHFYAFVTFLSTTRNLETAKNVALFSAPAQTNSKHFAFGYAAPNLPQTAAEAIRKIASAKSLNSCGS
jgi:hypothetical protein